MRVQFTVDDELGQQLQKKAHEMGLSVSSFIRYIVKDTMETKKLKLNAIDKAMLEPDERITLEDFKKQLGVTS
jgi:antitoxin component of RelBE/YafQ-DinJ toxin-antitoxin module